MPSSPNNTPPSVDANDLREMILCESHDAPFNPREMLRKAADYRRLEEAAKQVDDAEPMLVEWGDVYENYLLRSYYPSLDEIPEILAGRIDCGIDHYSITLRALLGIEQEDAEDDPVSRLTEEECDDCFRFITNPTDEGASTVWLLRNIPDVASKAKLIERQRRQALAKISLRLIRKPYCLSATKITPPPGLASLLDGVLEFWVFLSPDTENICPDEWSDATLLRMSAILVDKLPSGEATPIALVSGYHLLPFGNNSIMSESTFMTIMDAHSAHLNDVWKAIVGVYLPKNGWSSLRDFHEAFSEWTAGIAPVSIEVAPRYRGHRLSALVLDLLSEMTESASYFDEMIPRIFKEEALLEHPLSMAPICLFVVAIEGTPPAPGSGTVKPSLAYNVQTLPPRKVVDAMAERKRLKLTRYFNKISESTNRFDVLTYNPWDYPTT